MSPLSRILISRWPLLAALASATLLAVVHAIQAQGYAPCELCLKQREVYWVAVGVGLIGYVVQRLRPGPKARTAVAAVLALVFLVGAGIAAYHAGVEQKWWPGPTSCTGGGSVSANAMAGLLAGERIIPPQCDQIVWSVMGLSMAAWNVLVSLGLTALSVLAVLSARKQA